MLCKNGPSIIHFACLHACTTLPTRLRLPCPRPAMLDKVRTGPCWFPICSATCLFYLREDPACPGQALPGNQINLPPVIRDSSVPGPSDDEPAASPPVHHTTRPPWPTSLGTGELGKESLEGRGQPTDLIVTHPEHRDDRRLEQHPRWCLGLACATDNTDTYRADRTGWAARHLRPAPEPDPPCLHLGKQRRYINLSGPPGERPCDARNRSFRFLQGRN